MHLIEALVPGVAGCENGTAVITLRGTATSTTVYTDFEGTGSYASNTITLDARGGAVAYVDNVLVTVACKDSSGNTVRTFVSGVGAGNIEVKSDSFTGTAYSGAPTATSQPTTLKAVLDKWDNSAGADDFEVLFEGASTPLSSFASRLSGMLYNVKSTAYATGATGDGATDDTAAINAAISAASAAGGGTVYFPKGTYRITTTLNVPGTVSFAGVSPKVSLIKMDAASAAHVTFTSGTTNRSQVFRDLRFENAQSNSKPIFLPYSVSSTHFLAQNCVFGDSSYTKYVWDDPASAVVSTARFSFCRFDIGSTSGGHVVTSDSTSAQIWLDHCWLTTPNSFSGEMVRCPRLTVVGTRFEPGQGGAQSCIVIPNVANAYAAITGNEFNYDSSGTITGIEIEGTLSSTMRITESGNVFHSSVTPYAYTPAWDATRVVLGTRPEMYYRTSDNTTPLTIPADQYGVVVLRRTGGAVQTLNFNNATPGSEFTLVIYNNSGVTPLGAITWGNNVQVDSVTVPDDAKVTVVRFVCASHDGSTLVWLQANGTNFTP